MVTVSEFNDLEELHQFRLLWRSLWERTPQATIFQTLEWLQTYWREFGRGQKLRVLLVSVSGRPVGFVPLVVKRRKTSAGTLRVLSYPVDSFGHVFGPVSPYTAAILAETMRHLRDSARDWDVLDLAPIDSNGRENGRTHNAMKHRGFRPSVSQCDEFASVNLAIPWELYFQSRMPDLQNGISQWESAGNVEFIRYRPAGVIHGETLPRWDLMREFESLFGDVLLGHTEQGKILKRRRFWKDTHPLAIETGTLDFCLLRVHGQTVAGAYNYHHDGRVQGHLLAAREPQSDQMLHLLIHRMLVDSIERGDELYRFPIGAEEIACEWQTGIETTFRYTHYARLEPRAQLLRLRNWWDGTPAVQHRTVTPPSPQPVAAETPGLRIVS